MDTRTMSDQTPRDAIAVTSDIHPSVLIPEAREWALTNSGPVSQEFISALTRSLEESLAENERLRGIIAEAVTDANDAIEGGRNSPDDRYHMGGTDQAKDTLAILAKAVQS